MHPRIRLLNLLWCPCVALFWLAPQPARASESAFVFINSNPDNSANAIGAFSIDSAGHPSPVAGAPFATGGKGLAAAAGAEFAHRIVVSATSNLLFAANDGSATIAVFKIDVFSGALSAVPGSPFKLGAPASFSGISLAVSSDGRFLYASGSSVVSFLVDDNGGLNQLGAEWSFFQRVAGVAVSDDNSRVFLGTPGGVFVLHSGEGGLTAEAPSVVSIGGNATDLRINQDGSRLWVGTTQSGIQAYSFSAGGASPVPGMPFFTGVSNLSGLTSDKNAASLFAFAPTGPRLLGARANADGSLALGPGSPVSPALAPTGGALSPDGTRLLLADGLGQVDAWASASDGSLSHLNGYPVLSGVNPGFASVATLTKATPVPATPPIALFGLALLLLLGGYCARRSNDTNGTGQR
jgi:WD40 repeat protein